MDELSETKTKISSPMDYFSDFTLNELVDEQIWNLPAKSNSSKIEKQSASKLSFKEFRKLNKKSYTFKDTDNEDLSSQHKRNMKTK